MYSIVKSCNGISLVPVESRLFADRKIYIQGEITDEAACMFEQKIRCLLMEDSEKPIEIFVNSPGGSVSAGLYMYDILKGIQVEASICCCAMAASMAAVLLAGGQKGHRLLLPHSRVMIHEPCISSGVSGNAVSVQRTAQSIIESKRVLVELLAEDTGRSVREIERAISYDNYMNAQEALDFRIADRIVTEIC